jgi:hypothetical protein
MTSFVCGCCCESGRVKGKTNERNKWECACENTDCKKYIHILSVCCNEAIAQWMFCDE